MRSSRAVALPVLAAALAASGATASAAADDDRDKNVLLAEAQWQLFLLTSDFVPTDITCTRPPARDDSGALLCYALISDRVSVAAIATMTEPGIYTFTPLNKVDPADLVAEQPETPQTPDTPQTPETPETPETPGQGNATDTAILASIDAAVADAAGLGQVLMENNPAIVSVDDISFDAPTSTVHVAVTSSGTDPGGRDDLAFYVTDIMAYMWMEGEPVREPDATIHPRLEVDVDGALYGTPFDVMVQVADYTITFDEWLDAVTGGNAVRTASKQTTAIIQPDVKPMSKPVVKAGGQIVGGLGDGAVPSGIATAVA
jgi:hypothetical protein